MKISSLLENKNNIQISFYANAPFLNDNCDYAFNNGELVMFYGSAHWIDGVINPDDGDSYDDECDFAVLDGKSLSVFTYYPYIHGNKSEDITEKKYLKAKPKWIELMKNKYNLQI